MSVAPPFPLNPGEQVVRQGPSLYLRSTFTGIGYNPMPGQVWITNHRLMWNTTAWKRQLGMTYTPVAFPIRRITETAILPLKVQFSNEMVLRLTFDNRGKEYFVFGKDPESWQDTIRQAQAQAPMLDYQKPRPTTRPGVEGARKRAWMYLGALVIGIPTVCLMLCLLLAAIGSLLPE